MYYNNARNLIFVLSYYLTVITGICLTLVGSIFMIACEQKMCPHNYNYCNNLCYDPMKNITQIEFDKNKYTTDYYLFLCNNNTYLIKVNDTTMYTCLGSANQFIGPYLLISGVIIFLFLFLMCIITLIYYIDNIDTDPELEQEQRQEEQNHNSIPIPFKRNSIENCVICMEIIEENKTSFVCGHSLHNKCLNDYIKQSDNTPCPSCRKQLIIVGNTSSNMT